MNRKPHLELLTPDLDLTLTFVPGYDLLERSREALNDSEVVGIALALWELSGSDGGTKRPWREHQAPILYPDKPR